MRTKNAALLLCGVAIAAAAGFFHPPWAQRQNGRESGLGMAPVQPAGEVRCAAPAEASAAPKPGAVQAQCSASLVHEASSLGAAVPRSHRDGLAIHRKDLRLRQSLVGGAAVTPALGKGSYDHPGVLPGVHVLEWPSKDGLREFLRVAPQAAERLTYRIAIEDNQHAFKLRDGFLDVVDVMSRPVLNLEEPVYREDGQDRTEKGVPLPIRIELSGDRIALLHLQIPEGVRNRTVVVDSGWSEANYVPRRLLVKFRGEADVSGALRQVGGAQDGGVPQIGLKFVRLPAAASERACARALGMREDVVYAEVDALLPPSFIPNDPVYPNQWHHPNIGSPAAWDTTRGSNTVIVAVLDSGVDGTHPDLSANMVAGWNFYDGNSNTNDATGHGTAVAGTVAALGNNGIGVSGVAPNCRIMPLRTTDGTGYSTSSRVVSALTFAADNGARVANASIGKMGTSSSVNNAAGYLRSKGGVLCVAAGNEGADISSWLYSSNMIVVGATYKDVKTSWSNYGSVVEVVAPGEWIYSTNRGGTYGAYYGTSFASPVAAGVVALIRSANASLTPTQVENLLMSTAKDLGTAGRDNLYGFGRVDAAAAVAAAGGGQAVPPAITAQPASQTVMAGQTATFSVSATGVAPLAYQWRKNGAAIAGATSSSYTTPATTSLDNGSVFSAVVSNAGGSVTSNNATLTVTSVNQPPLIDSAPWADPNSILLGGTTVVNVVASDPDSGPSALSYTWSKVSGPGAVSFSPNGTAGSTSSTAGFSVAGTYTVRVMVSDGADAVIGDTDVVVTDPSVVATPTSLTASANGNTVTLRWTDNSTNETGFQIDRGTKVKNKVTWIANVAVVGANVTSFSQTVANGTYLYRVRAFHSSTGKVSANSNEVQVKVGTSGGGKGNGR